MRRFNINVNGTAYDVAVEELSGVGATAPIAAPAPTAPIAAPAPTPVAAGEGKKVESPMPGVIMDVKVQVGDMVKSGQPIVILEAMKMENDIVAPVDGKVTSLLVRKGDSVETNQAIATIA